MKDITKILVPFDVSTSTNNAIEYAINFARDDKNIEILLIHVNESGDNSLQKSITETIGNIKKAYPLFRGTINWTLKTGDLIDNILETQKQEQMHLVIMGTKGADEETEITNTSRLVLKADCPVIAIPENSKEFAVEKIALVLGKNEIDDASVLEILLDIARRFHSEVHVLTICNENESYGYSEVDEKNEKVLEYYLEKFYSHHTFQENTDIEKGIFDYINDKGIDLLAILPRNHATKNKPSEGRLTKLLTLHTEIPLLTID
ncbi:universal stress protein [Aquimarina gracilis]|uniref:Universal stress protein n=1 Tax=Aquimarina gracilis TaxID=874422 RepID=A0ABU5ZU08_9FLAO|nr:universal stress protein [Aquimarina gracilis]MEB3345032.1 universal stress protein [Aquimarina gracilis]